MGVVNFQTQTFLSFQHQSILSVKVSLLPIKIRIRAILSDTFWCCCCRCARMSLSYHIISYRILSYRIVLSCINSHRSRTHTIPDVSHRNLWRQVKSDANIYVDRKRDKEKARGEKQKVEQKTIRFWHSQSGFSDHILIHHTKREMWPSLCCDYCQKVKIPKISSAFFCFFS